uniref:KR domain-containing protein n=1 Tax=Nocardia cyriacigeorgica TaxID=135487 RepID=UPI002458D991
ARQQLAIWQDKGVQVTTERVDVTDRDAIAAVIARAHTPEHPLRGVFKATVRHIWPRQGGNARPLPSTRG